MIGQLRDELVELLGQLGSSATIYRTVPEQPVTPAVVIQPADPFVTDDDPDRTFAEPFTVAFELFLLVPLDDTHDNEQASDQLDQLLDQLLDVLRPSSWRLASMGQPGALTTTDWIEHGQRVTVRAHVQL